MRKPIRTAVLAVSLSLTFAASAAIAAPLAPVSQSAAAAAATALPVETVACVRGGWRGVGVYPGCGYYRRPYYRPAPYYVVRPYAAAPAYGAPVVVAGAPIVPVPRQCWIAGAWRPC
ncbi:hypothetical protein [Rhodopseudomonas palustris]|uniref:hypothetical protein n=1 Tax=Rhodopseudomonas palustris TaxID=1076 RepID=UPI00031F3A1E|nr:hypothetical protein [Rhodopseudomonas palustris]